MFPRQDDEDGLGEEVRGGEDEEPSDEDEGGVEAVVDSTLTANVSNRTLTRDREIYLHM